MLVSLLHGGLRDHAAHHGGDAAEGESETVLAGACVLMPNLHASLLKPTVSSLKQDDFIMKTGANPLSNLLLLVRNGGWTAANSY